LFFAAFSFIDEANQTNRVEIYRFSVTHKLIEYTSQLSRKFLLRLNSLCLSYHVSLLSFVEFSIFQNLFLSLFCFTILWLRCLWLLLNSYNLGIYFSNSLEYSTVRRVKCGFLSSNRANHTYQDSFDGNRSLAHFRLWFKTC